MGKDAFDGAVCLRLAYSRRMDEVLGFLGECWKDLGIPEQVQFDNARELCGWGPAARYLSRVIRFCLRFGVGPVFIPAGEPQFNGGVENFNGWFQPRLFDRRSAGRATCGGNWRGCRRRSTRSMSTHGWEARRRRSIAGACGCGSCPRASWCRRIGRRSRRGA